MKVGSPRPNIARQKHLWKKGQSGNPGGVPKNGDFFARAPYRYLKLQVRTGLAPLDFLVAVYRNELYDAYTPVTTTDGKVTLFRKKPGSKQINIDDMNLRVHAASVAAQYLHKKMPIGVENTGERPLVLIQAEQLSTLGTPELKALLAIMEKIGVSNATPHVGYDKGDLLDQDGKLLEDLRVHKT